RRAGHYTHPNSTRTVVHTLICHILRVVLGVDESGEGADKFVPVAVYLQAGRLARLPRHGVRLAVQVVVGLERLPQRPPAWNPSVVSRDQTFQSGLGHDLCAGNAPILTAVPQAGGVHGVAPNQLFWRDAEEESSTLRERQLGFVQLTLDVELALRRPRPPVTARAVQTVVQATATLPPAGDFKRLDVVDVLPPLRA